MGPLRHYHRKLDGVCFAFLASRFARSACLASCAALCASRTLKTSYRFASAFIEFRLALSAFASFAPHSLFLRSSPRPISIDKLSHRCVYTVNLSTLSSARGLTSLCCGILFLEGGFTLRCLQRLSRPYFASLLCRWHDNSCTRGTSIPVLSY